MSAKTLIFGLGVADKPVEPMKECEDCNGSGQQLDYVCGDGCCHYFRTCETCEGSGEIPETKGDENA